MKKEKKDCCPVCKLPLDIPREPVMVNENIFSIISYRENRCENCGHQADGSTLPEVYKLIQTLGNKFIKERDSIWEFIELYHELDDDQRKEKCVEVPNFCRPNYKSTGDMFVDDMMSPYSWNVVWFEVKSNTKFAKILIKSWHDNYLETK